MHAGSFGRVAAPGLMCAAEQHFSSLNSTSIFLSSFTVLLVSRPLSLLLMLLSILLSSSFMPSTSHLNLCSLFTCPLMLRLIPPLY